MLPVDPAGDKQEEEGEWARQLVHGESLPEGPPGFKSWNVVFSAVRHGLDPRSFSENPPSTEFSHRTGPIDLPDP